MRIPLSLSALAVLAAASALAQGQGQPPTPAQSIRRQFAGVNKRILEMAKDFPADKYGYRPTKEVRSFGEVMVHVMSGNVYGAKAGRGENVQWDELDAKNYKSKDEIVAALQKSIDDANATLKNTPDERFTKTLAPWLSIVEHAGEHYGQLVVYYRASGMIPPESRGAAKSN